MAELIDIIPAQNVLGEGVLWNCGTQTLWWTDIQTRRLLRYDLERKLLDSVGTPERVGSFGFVAGSSKLIVAFETGIGLHEPGSDVIEWLLRPDFVCPGLRFNDGRVDRQGRFWSGTMVEGSTVEANAALYCVHGRSSVMVAETGVSISNGICWSPDASRFYFADSPTRTIFAYDFDRDCATISNRRVFARTPDGAYPDGANVDSDGFLWSAQWGAGRVVRYAPDGTIDAVLDIPASQPTCIAFGGPELDLMFVTSARDGLNSDTLMGQPHAGDVFVFRMSVPGVPDGRFIL
ncbi:MAG: SMP-30/gluconolactonase/LRE family protein [Rhizomicrobium sp.]|jgi:sugar lactone lactonase YvrE